MREKFELHCKTIGLILFCIGAYYSLSSIPLFFQKQLDVTRMIPRSALRAFSQTDIAEMQASTSYMWKYAVKTLLILGITPILMGVYLMRTNNLFVRLCYPVARGSPSSIAGGADESVTLSASPKLPGSADDKKRGSQYAPPGYFD